MMTLSQASALVRSGEVSPLDLTRACLERIIQTDPELHVFVTVTAAAALQRAREAEHELARGEWLGPLHGIPVALKDLLDTAGVRTTAASRVFEKRLPTTDAEVVRRLKAAGAVIMGKTNLHEFAYGASSVVTAFGDVHNPWDRERIAGGSSSGNAVALATGMCYAAIGTDTAGSIRLPAAYCGVVGLKPTYGAVSCRGVIPLSWSLDHVGPMTRTAADAAIVYEALVAGPSSAPAVAPDDLPTNFRAAIARKYFFDALDPEIYKVMGAALRRIQHVFGELDEVEFEIDEDRTVHKAEAYAYHSEMLKTSADLYQPETKRRILSGERVLAAEYIAACRKLDAMRNRAHRVFEKFDVVVTPTTPLLPPTIAELHADAANLRSHEIAMLRNTRPFNVLGLPAVSIPCGRTDSGLPVGIQFTAAPGQERLLLRFAAAFENLR